MKNWDSIYSLKSGVKVTTEMQMKFHLTFERDEDGKYVAECTDMPGCLSEGDTLEEAIENMSEAIIGCLKSRLKIAGENLKVLSFENIS